MNRRYRLARISLAAFAASAALATAGATVLMHTASGSYLTPVHDLSTAPADFTIIGASTNALLGRSVATGDFNGDGIDDLLVGNGTAYVIFGSHNVSGSRDLAGGGDFTVTNGGVYAVAAGDFNGDGIADLLLGAQNAANLAGEAYVIYGSHTLSGVFDLSVSSPALTVVGAIAGDELGKSVAAGDFNGDGHDDVLVGAPQAPGNENPGPGEAFVIFYDPNWSVRNMGDGLGAYDLKVIGTGERQRLGQSVAAGDFNGDGHDDVLLGAPPHYPGSSAGEAFVIFNSPNWGVSSLALNEYNLKIVGSDAGDQLGASVAAGDINHDGNDDVLIGAPGVPGQHANEAGAAYVIYNAPNWGVSSIALGEYNLKVVGADAYDHLGNSVVSGDFNGDGQDDVLVGANLANGIPGSHGIGSREDAGQAYLIYHAPNWGVSSMELGEYNLTVVGGDTFDQAGTSVAAGDLNGDGVLDVVLGADSAGGVFNSRPSAGEVYVLFGPSTATPTPTPSPTPTATPSPTPTPSPTSSATTTQTANPTPSSTHSPTPTGSPPHPIQGDVNCDGSVNEADVEFLLQFVAHLIDGSTPGPCPDVGAQEPVTARAWGDVNCDGSVNALDALYLLVFKVQLHTLPSPPQGCFPIGSGIT